MERQTRESIVFCADGLVKLRYQKIESNSVKLYAFRNSEYTFFTEHEDYTVDTVNGIIQCLNNRITTYKESSFYNKPKFNHEDVASYGNYGWTYFVDYVFEEKGQVTDEQIAKEIVKPGLKYKVEETELKYIVFGDSISTGLEATEEQYMYFNRWTEYLKNKYTVNIDMENMAVGGETSRDGMLRFEKDVLAKNPKLVSIAYGMNDQCRKSEEKTSLHPLFVQYRKRASSECFVSLEEYKENIETMIVKLKMIDCQVILISPCLSNPRWIYSSGEIPEYANVLEGLADKYHLPFADITKMFKEVIQQGKAYECLLSNDINHPTDYGHKLYFDVLKELVY